MATRSTIEIKGWTLLSADSSWEDYHGMWCKLASDGSFYVLRWTNMRDAAGDRAVDKEGLSEYECDVRRVDFSDIPDHEITRALESYGFRVEGEEIISDSGDVIASDPQTAALVKVECAVSYGLGAPLESFTGNHYPLRVRAEARRYAESLMKDAPALARQLARPVNAIGSTAAEYGRGDTDSAIYRGDSSNPTNALMRKMREFPTLGGDPGKCSECGEEKIASGIKVCGH